MIWGFMTLTKNNPYFFNDYDIKSVYLYIKLKTVKMAVKIESISILKKYFSGVVNRANHHALKVNDIIYTLLGIIVLKKDDGSEIEVRGSSDDATGNILWVFINGNRYAFRYEHSDETIEIRKDSYNGPILLK